MATTFITNQFSSVPCAIFLNGGSYTKNVMRNASIGQTDDTGTLYKVNYEGSYYDINVDDIVFIIQETWLNQTGNTVKEEWTPVPINYSEYLN